MSKDQAQSPKIYVTLRDQGGSLYDSISGTDFKKGKAYHLSPNQLINSAVRHGALIKITESEAEEMNKAYQALNGADEHAAEARFKRQIGGAKDVPETVKELQAALDTIEFDYSGVRLKADLLKLYYENKEAIDAKAAEVSEDSN